MTSGNSGTRREIFRTFGDFPRLRWLSRASLLVAALSGCGAAGGTAVAPGRGEGGAGRGQADSGAHPELDLDQLAIRERMVRRIEALTKIGERHAGKDWELAEAADFVAAEWERQGFAVDRSGVVFEGRTLGNLSVSFFGTSRASEVVDVVAGYDSPLGSAGKSSAAAVAALLELSEYLGKVPHARTVRLWAVVCSEHAPAGCPPGITMAAEDRVPKSSLLPGPERYPDERVVFAIGLGHLGSSQCESIGGAFCLPFGGNVDGGTARLIAEAVEGEALVLGSERTGPPNLERFGELGIPWATFGGAGEEFEPNLAALVTSRLPYLLQRLALGAVTNDGMLTPVAPEGD